MKVRRREPGRQLLPAALAAYCVIAVVRTRVMGPAQSHDACLALPYDVICACDTTDASEYLECKQDPRQWLSARSAGEDTSPRVLLAREVLKSTQLVSVGSASGRKLLCSDIVHMQTLCTDRDTLDLFNFTTWLQLLGEMRSPPMVVFAEHVLEHFTPDQVRYAASSVFLSLQPGGVFRVAVPDGYKPSPSYQLYIGPGTTPSGKGNAHMVSYTKDSLVPIFRNIGFDIQMREYFDSEGAFHSSPDSYRLDATLGKIRRSMRHDPRNEPGFRLRHNSTMGALLNDLQEDEPVYSSLWFDAIKPDSCISVFQ